MECHHLVILHYGWFISRRLSGDSESLGRREKLGRGREATQRQHSNTALISFGIICNYRELVQHPFLLGLTRKKVQLQSVHPNHGWWSCRVSSWLDSKHWRFVNPALKISELKVRNLKNMTLPLQRLMPELVCYHCRPIVCLWMKIDIPQTFNRWLHFSYIYLLNYPPTGWQIYHVHCACGDPNGDFSWYLIYHHRPQWSTRDFWSTSGTQGPWFLHAFLCNEYINAFVRYGENKAIDPFLEEKGITVMFLFSIFVVPSWKFWYTNQSLTEAIPCCSPWSIYSSWCQWFCCWICWLHNWIRPTNISTRQPLPSPFWRGGRAMLGMIPLGDFSSPGPPSHKLPIPFPSIPILQRILMEVV